MRKRSILLLGGVLALLGSLVIGPAATAGSERTSAGTVVIIHDQEPPTLRNNWEDNNLLATALVVNNIFLGGQIYNNKAEYVPALFTAAPKLVKTNPQTVSFAFKPTAAWSDGKPVTCADFRATWKVFINPAFSVVSRTGWDVIKSVACKGKAGTVVFKSPYADWEGLLSGDSGTVYPAHIIAGQDMNQTFNNSIPVSDGPWKFQSWQKGVQITVVKNPAFKAGPAMKLDRVVWRYILDTNSRFQALKAGEGQVIQSQPQLQIADFLNDSKFTVQRAPEYAFEHLDIQFGPKGHPALKQAYVRQALASGINRAQIAQAIYKTIAPDTKALQSLIFKPFEKGYENHFGKAWPFSQAKVISLLKGKGCTGGPDKPSASNSSIFSCPGVGKLSFRFSTTTGNQLRALAFEIMQKQLKSVGIELVPRFQTGGVLFGTTLPSSDWDLIMFTYGQTPTSKITANGLYSCPNNGGDQNYGNWCSTKTTKLLNAVTKQLDENKRIQMLNQAEDQITQVIPSIPLAARPAFVLQAKTVKGPMLNPTTEGVPWNISSWTTS
jgi:peptide/nickel transport system substrate-binding protein